LVTKTKKREKDDVLEFAEVFAHYLYNIEQISRGQAKKTISSQIVCEARSMGKWRSSGLGLLVY